MKRFSLVVAALLLSAMPALAQHEALRFHDAFDRIDRMVQAIMRENKTPGIALALTTRDGPLRITSYGFADKDRRDPVTPQALFDIGSIGKSFTAVAAMELHDARKLDMQAPVKFEPGKQYHYSSSGFERGLEILAGGQP